MGTDPVFPYCSPLSTLPEEANPEAGRWCCRVGSELAARDPLSPFPPWPPTLALLPRLLDRFPGLP